MRAGRLQHKVWFDRPDTTQGANGEELIAWTPYAEVNAGIEPIRGKEVILGNQPIGTLDTRIITRWSRQLDVVAEKWRARFGGVVYDIVSPPVHRELGKREIEFLCRSGANNG